MSLEKHEVERFDAEIATNLKGVPLGKVICIAKAAWKAYKCETTGGQHCIETLVSDIEACVKS